MSVRVRLTGMRAHLRTAIVAGAGRRPAGVVPPRRQPGGRVGARSAHGDWSAAGCWRSASTVLTYVLSRACAGSTCCAPLGPSGFRSALRGHGDRVRGDRAAAGARRRGHAAVSAGAPRTARARPPRLPRSSSSGCSTWSTVLLLFAAFVLVCRAGAGRRADPACTARMKTGRRCCRRRRAVAGLVVLFVAGRASRAAWRALGAAARARAAGPRCAARWRSFVETFATGLAIVRQPQRLLVALAAVVSAVAVDRARASGAASRAFHIDAAVHRVVPPHGAAGRRRGGADARRRRRLPRGVPARRDGVLRRRRTIGRSARPSCCTRSRSCR